MSAQTTVAEQEYAVPAAYTLTEDNNLARLAWRQAQQFPQRVVYERFVDGAWQGRTAELHQAAVLAAARGLAALGVNPGDRVAVMAATSYEWVVVDGAIWAAGAVTVPIYPSSSVPQVEWIVQDSESVVLVVENEHMREMLQDSAIGDVRVLVLDDDALAVLTHEGTAVPAEQIHARVESVTLDDPATIVYTSGTTGRPKGCVLTHRNLAAEVQSVLTAPIGEAAAGPGKRTLMFLPLAHVLARAVTYMESESGATVGFWSDTKTITDKLASFSPNLVLGVPRIFEKVHDGARHKARSGGPLKAEVFRRAEEVAVRWSRTLQAGDKPSLRLRAEHAVFDRLVYHAIRAALGGKCHYAISGGGALREDLGHFFTGLGVPVYEGYGLTETCAAICVNQPGAVRIGTVGRPLSGNGVRVGSDHEIQLKGDVVFREYWNNAEASEAAFEDGWFRTGDLGNLDADGFLRVTGRKKEIIVTAGGKNIAPGPMEDALRTNPVVGHAVVVGEGKPFVAALITLDPDGVTAWAADNGRAGLSMEQLCEDPQLRSFVQNSVDEASAQVSHAEGIKKFVLLPQDFSEETGELTATLKVKRHVVDEKYQRQLRELYHRR